MAGPYTVGTTNRLDTFDYPLQRRTFYGATRYWVFWLTNGDMVFSSSTDGETWESPTTLKSGLSKGEFSIWFDGTYLHYAVYVQSIYDLFYRRGTPLTNGTITWTAEQTVYNGTYSDRYLFPVISVDSLGHAWIGVEYVYGSNWYAEVFKNDNTDGTWSTASGFPYRLVDTSLPSRYVIPVPLTGGQVACVHSRCYGAIDDLYLRLYDGASWDPNVNITSSLRGSWMFDAVAEGDDVHIVWVENISPYHIKYRKWDYDTGLEAPITLESGVGTGSVPCLTIDWANMIYCFWRKGNYIYYKKLWDSTVEFISESGIDPSISTFYEDYNSGIIPVAFVNGSLDIRFAWISSSSGTKIGDWLIDDDDACERILAFEIGSAAEFAKKDIIGKDTPTVDGSNYTITPRAYKITARVGTTKRNNLQTTKDAHETIVLDSPFANVNDLVKFEEFEYRWAGNECYACPWLIIMIFISTQH